MNKLALLEAFIKEKDLSQTYTEWLESKLYDSTPTNDDEVDLDEIEVWIKPAFGKDYDTQINYHAKHLSYQVEVIFPRVLSRNEEISIENIINYWSAIPYVSVEGNYGMSWGKKYNMSFILIEIDFTKSASDDYISREVLEKLAEWIRNGTPERRDRTRKHESLGIKPVAVRADSV